MAYTEADTAKPPAHGRKRKHAPSSGPPPKKSKTSAAQTKPLVDRSDVDAELQINPAIAQMDGALMADFIAKQTQRFEKDLSLVELEDRRIPETAFADGSSWNQIRTLENLPSFLELHSRKSRDELAEPPPSDSKGTPKILVVTSAGLRAADITRALRVYQTKSVPIAKLFAKHIKLKEAVEFVKKTRINIGVGTPQRLLDLVEQDALSLDALTYLVLDGSHVDAKSRGLFDMRETLSPMTKLLSRHQLRQSYGDRQSAVKILVF